MESVHFRSKFVYLWSGVYFRLERNQILFCLFITAVTKHLPFWCSHEHCHPRQSSYVVYSILATEDMFTVESHDLTSFHIES